MVKLIGELKIGQFELEHTVIENFIGQPENSFEVIYTTKAGFMKHYPIMQPFKANIRSDNVFHLVEYNNKDYRDMLEDFINNVFPKYIEI